MGDPSRFWKFARFIAKVASPGMHIADVAGGKGKLRGALWMIGLKNVTTIDVRHEQARRGAYRLFDYRTEPGKYDLLVGMHPDAATDHIIMFSGFRRVPAIICPCCVMPSASRYGGRRGYYPDWLSHLKSLSVSMRMKVLHTRIDIAGRNDVLYLEPK